jgi:2-deoxy-D-gluconate 3-dehydrogenase
VSNPFSLSGRVALVTGGATGIGRAVAEALAAAGADVAITTHERAGTDTEAAITRLGRRGQTVRADLSALEASSAGELLDRVAGVLGEVDILVNNAGVIHREPAATHDDESWRAVMAVNLDAPWILCREAGKRMIARGAGKIINIASLLSFQGGVAVPAYTASKHAVAGLTKALANEWARTGVNVNAIAPGYIATSNTEALRAEETRNRQILERIPAGRWGDAADIAGAAVFLASSASDYVNGHVLPVDGGWLAR